MSQVILFVSTPCYGGVCLQAYAESMLRLQRTCAVNGIQMMLDTTENESLIPRARNLAVARFMQKTQATHFLFIDADIHFDPESVIRLIKSGYEVSCAAYPKKCVMWDQAENYVKSGKEGRDLARVASSARPASCSSSVTFSRSSRTSIPSSIASMTIRIVTWTSITPVSTV